MMDDATANAKKAALDEELKDADPNVGLAFGLDLFAAFIDRKWLTVETFGVLGTTALATKVPAYNKSHYAFATWDLPGPDFKVGKIDNGSGAEDSRPS